MLSSREPPFIFIHIPRTGGTSISLAIHRRFPRSTIDFADRKHATARQLAKLPHWTTALKIALFRPPHQILASWFANAVTWHRRYHSPDWTPTDPPPTPEWVEYADRLHSLTFDRWLEEDVWTGKWPARRTFRATWLEPHLDELLLIDASDFQAAWAQVAFRLRTRILPWPPADTTVDETARPDATPDFHERCREHFASDYELLHSLHHHPVLRYPSTGPRRLPI